MPLSKQLNREHKGISYILSRNDQDVGAKWSASNDDWIVGPYPLKRDAVDMAEYIINYKLT